MSLLPPTTASFAMLQLHAEKNSDGNGLGNWSTLIQPTTCEQHWHNHNTSSLFIRSKTTFPHEGVNSYNNNWGLGSHSACDEPGLASLACETAGERVCQKQKVDH